MHAWFIFEECIVYTIDGSYTNIINTKEHLEKKS